jgi:hypothetical protein
MVVMTAVTTVASMLTAQPAADAAPADVLTLVGFGTIAPGLPCDTCTLDINFAAIVVGSATGVWVSCNFHADSGPETLTGGAGAGTVGGCGISGEIGYNRLGGVVTLSGCLWIGVWVCIGASALLLTPTSAAPTTSFTITGSMELEESGWST